MRAFELGDSVEEEQQLFNVANDYLSEGDFVQATRYLERALRLAAVRGDRVGTCRLLLRLATLYYYGMREQVPRALALWRIGVVYLVCDDTPSSRWPEGVALLSRFMEDLAEMLGPHGFHMLWVVSEREYEQTIAGEEFSRTLPALLEGAEGRDLFLFLAAPLRALIREAMESAQAHQAPGAWEEALTRFFAGYSCEGRFSMEEACAHYEAAAALVPDFAAAYTRQGKALLELDAYDRARAALNQAVSVDPHAWLPHALLGQSHFLTDRYDLALTAYDLALQLNPTAWSCLCARARVYIETREYRLAMADSQRVLDSSPLHDEAWLILGQAQLGLGEYERARLALAEAIAQESLYEPEAHYFRGLTYLWLHDERRARTDFLRSWQQNTEQVRAKVMLVWLAWGQKKPSRRTGRGWFDTAFLNLPDYYAYLLSYLALYITNEIGDALYELDGAIKRAPERFESHFWRGLLRAHLGKSEEALASLEQALSLGMPPVLLAPLRWLEQDKPESWRLVAPFLSHHQGAGGEPPVS